jgi:hypothetical protein
MKISDKNYYYSKPRWSTDKMYNPHLGLLIILYWNSIWCYGRIIKSDTVKILYKKNGDINIPSETVMENTAFIQIDKLPIVIDDVKINDTIRVLQKVNRCLVIKDFQSTKQDVE